MNAKLYLIIGLAIYSFFVSSPLLHAASLDRRIESAATQSYNFKTTLQEDSIDVDSKNGEVTLSGTVADASHKSLAEFTVESLPGVTAVHNKLIITTEEPEEYSDAWIGMKVKASLLFHRDVSGSGTSVDVAEGVVVLSGEASSLAQKELATAYAEDIDHVKSVVNHMTIEYAPESGPSIGDKIDNASITAQVKFALLFH
jgi:hyperosmotically inducible protein